MARVAPNSLQVTMILTVALPMILVTGVTIWWGLQLLNTAYESQMQEDLQLVARATRYPLSRALEKGDIDGLDDILRSIFSMRRVYGASVYGVKGDRVARYGIADRDLKHSGKAADVVATGQVKGDYRQVEGRPVFSQFTPLMASDGRIEGLLQITRRRSDFDRRFADLRRDALWLWGAPRC